MKGHLNYISVPIVTSRGLETVRFEAPEWPDPTVVVMKFPPSIKKKGELVLSRRIFTKKFLKNLGPFKR